MAVKFLMPFNAGALYEEGEVAGFDKKTEADLVRRKIAEPHRAEPGKDATSADVVDGKNK